MKPGVRKQLRRKKNADPPVVFHPFLRFVHEMEQKNRQGGFNARK